LFSGRYDALSHCHSPSEEGFSVSVPGLPGCWSQSATDVEAVENIKDAIREYLGVVEEQLRGEEIREIEVAV
jgi:predicted RNase H-like HicB family nuclease